MRALVVDDNTINLKVAARILENLGFAVDTVLSGKECLEIIKTNTYDVIFMDIMMPEMDGVETFKKLKKNPEFNIPVITLTADDVEGAREKYLEIGFVEYISKPINIELMKDILSKLNII